MNILITGANGFIGRALCKRLLADGYQVRGAVRGQEKTEVGRKRDERPTSNIERPTLNEKQKKQRKEGGGLRVDVGDIGPETDWSNALSGIEGIVHLAARVHVMRESVADPLAEFRKVNTAGTLNLARQAVAAGVKRFVFISTVKVNGERTDVRCQKSDVGGRGKIEVGGQRSEVGEGIEVRSHPSEMRSARHGHELHGVKRSEVREKAEGRSDPYTEMDKPEPRDAYAVSKWEAEQGLLAIAEETGLEVVIIRPPLVYGPGVKANFRLLMKWVRIGVPLPLGAVYNKRSFVALDNLVSFIIRCIDHPKAANEVFLISDGEDVSTTELLQKMARAFGKRSFLFPVPVGLMTFVAGLLGKKDVADRLFGSLQVDISKARDLLGWEPVVSMDEGLVASRKGAKIEDRDGKI